MIVAEGRWLLSLLMEADTYNDRAPRATPGERASKSIRNGAAHQTPRCSGLRGKHFDGIGNKLD